MRLPRLSLALEPGLAEAPAIAPAARKRSILVVDDNADSAASIAMFLRLLGHEVETDGSGAGALRRVEEGTAPEVIILDIGLPGLDGYEVARALRAMPKGKGLRLYAMTGYGQPEDRQRSLAAGFDVHLVKPIVPAELARLIDSIPAG